MYILPWIEVPKGQSEHIPFVFPSVIAMDMLCIVYAVHTCSFTRIFKPSFVNIRVNTSWENVSRKWIRQFTILAWICQSTILACLRVLSYVLLCYCSSVVFPHWLALCWQSVVCQFSVAHYLVMRDNCLVMLPVLGACFRPAAGQQTVLRASGWRSESQPLPSVLSTFNRC